MEEKVTEKKVLEQEVAEELRDEQMECVSGGQESAIKEDGENREVIDKNMVVKH